MGYSTDFDGSFKLDRPLSEEHAVYLRQFAETRRVVRSAEVCQKMEDPLRIAVGLPVGIDGEFFIGGPGFFGQDHDPSVKDDNSPPRTQPGLWCQWIPSEDNSAIEWDGGEKFYNYLEWIQYIIKNFLKPWKYVINGEVTWQGEEETDVGVIKISNNIVSIG